MKYHIIIHASECLIREKCYIRSSSFIRFVICFAFFFSGYGYRVWEGHATLHIYLHTSIVLWYVYAHVCMKCMCVLCIKGALAMNRLQRVLKFGNWRNAGANVQSSGARLQIVFVVDFLFGCVFFYSLWHLRFEKGRKCAVLTYVHRTQVSHVTAIFI